MQSRLFRSSSFNTVCPIKKTICSEIENLLHGCFIIFSRIYYCFVSKQNEAKRKQQKKLSEIGKQLLYYSSFTSKPNSIFWMRNERDLKRKIAKWSKKLKINKLVTLLYSILFIYNTVCSCKCSCTYLFTVHVCVHVHVLENIRVFAKTNLCLFVNMLKYMSCSWTCSCTVFVHLFQSTYM